MTVFEVAVCMAGAFPDVHPLFVNALAMITAGVLEASNDLALHVYPWVFHEYYIGIP